MTPGARLAGLDDDTIAREQFDHYIGQVDPAQWTDWDTLRRRLAVALESAGCGIAVFAHRPLGRELLRIAARRQQLADLIDAVRRDHPDAGWDEFRSRLYHAWRGLDAHSDGEA